MKIDGNTRLAAVVAKPIKHSISPFIHNLAFESLGINGVYLAFEIDEVDLEQTIENIRRYNMWGINLSMPYKNKVLPYLDEIDDSAALSQAVNTIVNCDGRLIGYNTDGYGFFASLPVTFQLKDSVITLLGGKGAATAILVYAVLNGAKKINLFCKEKYLVATKERLEHLRAISGTLIEIHSFENQNSLQQKISESDLVVNTSNVGMNGKDLPVPKDIVFSSKQLIADIIYQPFETPFLALAKKQGNQTINGLGMLLFQAARAFELWTGNQMPIDSIWQELEKMYKN